MPRRIHHSPDPSPAGASFTLKPAAPESSPHASVRSVGDATSHLRTRRRARRGRQARRRGLVRRTGGRVPRLPGSGVRLLRPRRRILLRLARRGPAREQPHALGGLGTRLRGIGRERQARCGDEVERLEGQRQVADRRVVEVFEPGAEPQHVVRRPQPRELGAAGAQLADELVVILVVGIARALGRRIPTAVFAARSHSRWKAMPRSSRKMYFAKFGTAPECRRDRCRTRGRARWSPARPCGRCAPRRRLP